MESDYLAPVRMAPLQRQANRRLLQTVGEKRFHFLGTIRRILSHTIPSLKLKIAQTSHMVWSLGPKTLKM